MDRKEILKRVSAAHQDCQDALRGNLSAAGSRIAQAETLLGEILAAEPHCSLKIGNLPCGRPLENGYRLCIRCLDLMDDWSQYRVLPQ